MVFSRRSLSRFLFCLLILLIWGERCSASPLGNEQSQHKNGSKPLKYSSGILEESLTTDAGTTSTQPIDEATTTALPETTPVSERLTIHFLGNLTQTETVDASLNMTEPLYEDRVTEYTTEQPENTQSTEVKQISQGNLNDPEHAETTSSQLSNERNVSKDPSEPLNHDLILSSEKPKVMGESDALDFINKTNTEFAAKFQELFAIRWNYQTNITKENKQNLVSAQNAYGEWKKDAWKRIQKWKKAWPTFTNATLRRQFEKYSKLGNAALPQEKLERFNSLQVLMSEIYSTAKICDYRKRTKCDLSLEPEIKALMGSSRNYDELVYLWKSWRDKFSQTKQLYSEFVQLSNEAAELNGFPSTAEMWTHDYESETLEDDLSRLYEQLKPLYKQLHAYTRRKLREIYGESRIPRKGPIPAHVTGNMWAQSFLNIYDLLIPYANKTSVDVTDALISQGYTPRLMFEKADDFFASMGLERVPETFWNNSMIEKPVGRDVVCHASAWDLFDRKDFRIKQCTTVGMEDFFTVHHEMGHIQYYLQYKDLPTIFRAGANPGFHEAVGDLIFLSVAAPKHLHKIGLLDTHDRDNEADINFLMSTALDKVTFLPFGYLVDKYRWEIFRGSITPENYTRSWWQYRYEFQGIASPVPRSEVDFDPAAKSHVSTNTRYIRYFVSTILQFQFHKAACLLALEFDPNDPRKPLHKCSIHESAEAGSAIRDMLKLGSSKHWREPLKALTGTTEIDATALREYFRPLEEWLIADNKEHGEFVGWEGGDDFIKEIV